MRSIDTQTARALLNRLYKAIERLRNLRAVTVCACGGYALDAGLELAMACDFQVATTDAALGLPEIDVGLVTGIQGGLLIRLVGLQRAKEMIFTGGTVQGDEAAEMGLMNRAVNDANHEEAVATLVDDLAAKRPEILQRQTDVFRAWRSVGVNAGVRSSREIIALCFGTKAQRESMAAFLGGE